MLTQPCFAADTPQQQWANIAQAAAAWAGVTFDPNCAVGQPDQALWQIYNAFSVQGNSGVVASSPVTGATILAPSFAAGGISSTNYLTPAGTIATLTWSLPASADSKVGMTRRIATTQTITALTVNVVGGGSLIGTALTTLAANATASYQCVSVTGAGTWLRIS